MFFRWLFSDQGRGNSGINCKLVWEHQVRHRGVLALIITLLFAGSPTASGLDVPPALSGMQVFASPPEIPEITFFTDDGTKTSIAAFAGKTVILNLWATWCSYCVEEMPALDKLAKTIDGRYVVLLVSQDKGGLAVAQPFLQSLSVASLKTYLDPQNNLMRTFGVAALPTTLIISPNGKLIGRLNGVAEWDHPDALRYLQTLGKPVDSH